MRVAFLIGGLALAVIIVVAIQYGSGLIAEDVEPVPAVVAEPQAPPDAAPGSAGAVPEPESLLPPPEVRAPESRPEVALPPLAQSDAFVVEHLAGFGWPDLWLDREELIRRLALVIDNAAKGEYPRRQLSFLAPTARYQIVELGERFFIDPAGYARYDIYLDLLENVEPQSLAEALLLFEPLITESLAELGNHRSMVVLMHMAISRITELPTLPEDVELLQPKVFFEYADPELEALAPLQKLALRMGPSNVRRLQDYLRAFQVELAANQP